MGPVIPQADFERIFDRYYRSSASSNRALEPASIFPVAKRTAQAQGSHVWVTNETEKKGTTFYTRPLQPCRKRVFAP